PARHDLERARLDDVMQRTIVEAELFARDCEVKRAALAGPERDALEALQLFDGARARGRNVARVELYDLVARAPARVLHVNAYVEAARRVDARRAQSKVRQAEGRVTEAVAEGEERRPRHVNVLGRVVVVRVGRAARVDVVVVERLLPDGARERRGQLAAGVHVAEENVGQSVPGLRAGEPRFEYGGRVLRDPVD